MYICTAVTCCQVYSLSMSVCICIQYTLWALMNCWRLEHLVSIHAIRYVSHIAIPGVLLLLKKKEHIGVCHIV